MVRFLFFLVLLVSVQGCLSEQIFPRKDKGPEAVAADPFNNAGPVAPARNVNFAPAPHEISERVDFIGRKVLAANPQIGLKPLFATIGSPAPEVFHKGTSMVYVTAGLVSQCQTEAQLAAVLSQELGKMVSEREAAASSRARDPERLAPIEVPIGQAGGYSSPDMTHMAELGRLENSHPRSNRRLPPPDPQELARAYLQKAGYHQADLDSVSPILQSAEKNFTLEKQLKGGMPQANWMP